MISFVYMGSSMGHTVIYIIIVGKWQKFEKLFVLPVYRCIATRQMPYFLHTQLKTLYFRHHKNKWIWENVDSWSVFTVIETTFRIFLVSWVHNFIMQRWCDRSIKLDDSIHSGVICSICFNKRHSVVASVVE